MKEYKYVTNMGVAFDEGRILKKLSRLASEGWVLDELTLFRGYRLKKSKPQELVYSLDYKQLDQDELDEYIEMFEAGGWEHIYSYQYMHFFAAPPGTTPIYTDKESHQHMYKTQRIQMFRSLVVSFIISLLMFAAVISGFYFVESAFFRHSLTIILGISAGITFCFVMMLVAYYWREKKVKSLQ